MNSIYEYQDHYFKEKINLEDIFSVYSWCQRYNLYRPAKDCSDVLFRFNVSVYQIASLILMRNSNKKIDMYEMAECLCSIYVHAVSSFECIFSVGNSYGCYKTLHKTFDLEETTTNINIIHNNIVNCNKVCLYYSEFTNCIPFLVKQILYFKMGRKNRFDLEQFEKYTGLYLGCIHKIYSYYVGNRLKFSEGIKLVLDKLQATELKTH
jgi:hypothetical protein